MTTATSIISPIDIQPLLLDVSTTTLTVTPEQFVSLCLKNPDLRLELTTKENDCISTCWSANGFAN